MAVDNVEQYLLTVGEDEFSEDNILRTSLVANPATQKLFAIFSSQEKNANGNFKVIEPTPTNDQVVAKTKKFERIISGVWFMPDTDYMRYDDDLETFFTTRITKEELKKATTFFVKNDFASEFNVNHDTDARELESLTTIEIWILEDHKQLSPILGNSIETLGYSAKDIPLGTVFMTVFCSDEQFFKDKILSGEVKGFSIEGFFKLTKVKKEAMGKQKEMFSALGLVQEVGVLVLADNTQLAFAKEGVKQGNATAKNGEYKTAKGFSIIIRDGKVVDFGFENEGADDAAAKAAADAVNANAQKAVADAAVQAEAVKKAAETTKTETQTEEQRVAALVAAHLKKNADDKAAADALAAKEAERQKVIDDLKAENERLQKDVKIPKPVATVVTDYNKETHEIKTVGGRQMVVKKR